MQKAKEASFPTAIVLLRKEKVNGGFLRTPSNILFAAHAKTSSLILTALQSHDRRAVEQWEASIDGPSSI